jgi:anhydro-N-acetylmuramic acid kinase
MSQHPTTRLIAGAMSGTSADGVDVAITRVDGTGLDMTAQLVHHHHRPYDPALRQNIFEIRAAGQASLADLARLARDISLTYAACVNEALVRSALHATDLAAVAAHGQTLYHAPPDTIQWLDPALIAAETHCPVVSDFRRADCAAGGQGAPLVPFADYILFRHLTINRMLLNLGGIANVTCLFAGAPIDKVIAFDTGPGNCISDYLMRTHRCEGPGHDVDGALAARGRVIRPVDQAFSEHSWFIKLGPKSTDGPAMIRIFRDALKGYEEESLEDQLATACHVAVRQILHARSLFGGQLHGELIASGGGTRNQTIMRMLREWFTVRTTEEFGIPSEAKEAIAFALLAAATLDNSPSNLPSCTGAKQRAVLGSITPRPT